jgi:hypothetical protein
MRLNRYDWPAMQTTASPGEAGPGRTLWATLLLLVLVACQVRWALGWFGPDLPTAWQQLVSDEPIYTARHPLHLYHAQLGAAALRVWGTSACYDPAFQAGYPKTLFFDEGCRPAELLLAAVRHAAGPRIAPALVYKGWLLGACVAVPLLLALAAWGLGARWLGWLTAAGLGCALTWTQPVSGLLECGDADVVVGGAALATHAGLLVRFVRLPGVRVWLGLALTATLGWASWPIVWAAATPLVLAAYLALARRLTLAQHLALGTLPILLGFCHAESLEQLTAHWWICLPVGQVNLPLPSEPMPTPWPQWLAVVWGLGGLGLLGRLAAGERLTPYLLGGWLMLLLAAWWHLHQGYTIAGLDLARAAALAGWLCAAPAALVMAAVVGWLVRRLRHALGGLGLGGLILLVGWLALHPQRWHDLIHQPMPTPLQIGLRPEQADCVQTLRTTTTAHARILWEDRPTLAAAWSAYLPILTDRHLLGGLGPGVHIEHGYLTLANGKLGGKALTDWSDGDLEQFCRRYNVGWVVGWSAEVRQRLEQWPKAWPTAKLHDGTETGTVFAVKTRPSFVLRGQARIVQSDWRRIALADVVPQAGRVTLSFHYQPGMRVWPSDLQLERDNDPHDPVPLLCLRVPRPTARITITWEGGR